MVARRGFLAPGRIARLSLIALAGVLLVLPAATAARSIPTPAVNDPQVVSGPSATWNGHDLSQASSTGSAFSLNAGDTVEINFSFPVIGPGPSPISTARVVVYYFGAAISANSVATNPVLGEAKMNWTLGSYTYLLQGTYRLSATLVYSNGTNAWSEDFYIDAKAPYRIGSGLTVFLIILGVVEAWSIATSARGPRRRAKRPAPPSPWQEKPAAEGPAAPPSGSPPPGPETPSGPPPPAEGEP